LLKECSKDNLLQIASAPFDISGNYDYKEFQKQYKIHFKPEVIHAFMIFLQLLRTLQVQFLHPVKKEFGKE